MWEKGKNLGQQLFLHLTPLTHLAKVRKLWLWLKLWLSWSFLQPRLCPSQRKAFTLLSGHQSQALQHLTGFPWASEATAGTTGQAGDMESCWMAKPGCKKGSCLCGKEHYCWNYTGFFFKCLPQQFCMALISAFTPFYVLTIPAVGTARPFWVTALVLSRKGGTSLPQAFEWLRFLPQSRSAYTLVSILQDS